MRELADEATRLPSAGHWRRRNPVAWASDTRAVVRRSIRARSGTAEEIQYRHQEFAADLQPGERATQARCRPAVHALLDVELSLGSQPRRERVGQPLLYHGGGAPGGVAELRDAAILGEGVSAGHRRSARAVSPVDRALPAARGR